MKYPVPRKEYCQKVGQTRVNQLAATLRDLGFKVNTYPKKHKCDISIYNPRTKCAVIEVKNENIESNYESKEVDSILDRFRKEKKDIHKILVCSHKGSFSKEDLQRMKKEGIKIIEIGFQVLPEDYYNFYKGKKKQIKKDDIHSFEETKEIMETELKKISPFLISRSYP